MEFAIILVEPLYEGNIGAVARTMSNFSINRLILVNPCAIGDEAKRRAKHGGHLLGSAKHYGDLDSALKTMDFCVATTGIRTGDLRKHTRSHHTPEELCGILEPQIQRDISIGLVLGRENYGLYNEELRKCDLVVSVPTADNYPVLNLSHAVCILCYELYTSLMMREERETKEETSPEIQEQRSDDDKELFLTGLLKKLDTILDLASCPEHRKEIIEIAFRRVLGRALITEWEYHRLMGFLSLTERTLKT